MITAIFLVQSVISLMPTEKPADLMTKVAQCLDNCDEKRTSMLAGQEQALNSSEDVVRFYVIKSVFPDIAISERQFRGMDEGDKSKLLAQAYYKSAFFRAVLLHRGDSELVDILNKMAHNNDLKEVCLEFEKAYVKKFGSFPDIVPVDVAHLTRRLLDNRLIR
jgi:hypothetical protein